MPKTVEVLYRESCEIPQINDMQAGGAKIYALTNSLLSFSNVKTR